jgi:peroxiredoxin
MKSLAQYFAVSLCLIVLFLTGISFHDDANTLKLFNQTAKKLQGLKLITYRYTREFNYPSEGYVSKAAGKMFVDFGKEDDLVGFRYQYSTDGAISIFNNSEIFGIDTKEKTIEVNHQIKPVSLEGKSALYNSIITLRNALPLVANDKSVPKSVRDTLIENTSFNLLQFTLHNRLINYLGTGFTTTTGDLTFVYKVVTDKHTNLPLTVLQTRIGSADLNRTDFNEINTAAAPVAEKLWYYSSYLNTYTLNSPEQTLTIIKSGQTAPDWALTNFATNNVEKLSAYKGKPVLLEFWIKNCGHCIEAVTGLNDLNDLYANRGLKVLAINTEDSKASIGSFIEKQSAKYSIVYGNEPSVNKRYGVAAFPQVVLINKAGVVIYSGNFDVQKLKGLLNNGLL